MTSEKQALNEIRAILRGEGQYAPLRSGSQHDEREAAILKVVESFFRPEQNRSLPEDFGVPPKQDIRIDKEWAALKTDLGKEFISAKKAFLGCRLSSPEFQSLKDKALELGKKLFDSGEKAFFIAATEYLYGDRDIMTPVIAPMSRDEAMKLIAGSGCPETPDYAIMVVQEEFERLSNIDGKKISAKDQASVDYLENVFNEILRMDTGLNDPATSKNRSRAAQEDAALGLSFIYGWPDFKQFNPVASLHMQAVAQAIAERSATTGSSFLMAPNYVDPRESSDYEIWEYAGWLINDARSEDEIMQIVEAVARIGRPLDNNQAIEFPIRNWSTVTWPEVGQALGCSTSSERALIARALIEARSLENDHQEGDRASERNAPQAR